MKMKLIQLVECTKIFFYSFSHISCIEFLASRIIAQLAEWEVGALEIDVKCPFEIDSDLPEIIADAGVHCK